MNKGALKGILAVLLVCLMLAGCRERAGEQETVASEQDDKIQIGITFDSFVIERWQRDRDVFVSTAQELGAEVNVQNANGDLKEQIAQVDYFIQKKVDVILIIAIDSDGLTEAVERAQTKQMGSGGRCKMLCASQRKALLRTLFVHLCCHRGAAGEGAVCPRDEEGR